LSAGDWKARLRIHATAFLAPGAVVTGDVEIGAGSSVWFNTVVRGDTDRIAIGEQTNLQDNSVVHVDAGMPAILGNRVTVGHRSIIHGCRIDDDCLIGMGSVVLSGAHIGAGSLIGAASLIREGQEIPAGSLAFGSPAKVVGTVAQNHREAIRHGAAHYAELARSYLERGFAMPHPAESADSGRTSRERGPMTWLEWEDLRTQLAQGPEEARRLRDRAGPERWKQTPAAGRWSAAEIVGHLEAGDRLVFGPRLERFLEGAQPSLPLVDLTQHAASADPEKWAQCRGNLLKKVAPLGPEDWARLGWHERLGPYRLADMVRFWVEHDLSHRRQMRAALDAWA
jgi:carbonic anhydrase/acetyltransferase-like protein (isoleucine patch superfamily)